MSTRSYLFSGQTVDLLNLEKEQIRIVDIVEGLSKTCRFNGQCRAFYSVAEHSLLVAKLMKKAGFNERYQCAGLLHDAAEAYIGDIVKPIKADFKIGGRTFSEIERDLMCTMYEALGLDLLLFFDAEAEVDRFDKLAVGIEMRQLFAVYPDAFDLPQYKVATLDLLTPTEARDRFMKAFTVLKGSAS